MPDTRTGVYAEGGLGRFDTLPGDIQLLIWDMVAGDVDKAARTIQRFMRRFSPRILRWRAMYAGRLVDTALQRAEAEKSDVSAVAWSWTDKCNGWWCDVAADGCLRPCDSDNYAPAVHFANGGGYVACEECFDSHLSQPEQRRGFIRVEPVSEPRG